MTINGNNSPDKEPAATPMVVDDEVEATHHQHHLAPASRSSPRQAATDWIHMSMASKTMTMGPASPSTQTQGRHTGWRRIIVRSERARSLGYFWARADLINLKGQVTFLKLCLFVVCLARRRVYAGKKCISIPWWTCEIWTKGTGIFRPQNGC